MAEVTLIDFSYLNRLALPTFTEVGPQFSNQDSSKVQPCPTSSGSNVQMNKFISTAVRLNVPTSKNEFNCTVL